MMSTQDFIAVGPTMVPLIQAESFLPSTIPMRLYYTDRTTMASLEIKNAKSTHHCNSFHCPV